MSSQGIDNSHRAGGSALLMLLITVAIVMMLYFADFRAIFGPGITTRSSRSEYRPWLDEHRIANPDKIIEMPKPPKPTLDDPVSLVANVTREGSDRGKLKLRFSNVGETAGRWRCQYSHQDRDYTFDSEFAGNIDAEKTYSQGPETDGSQLFFITRGSYRKTIRNTATDVLTAEEGIVYVTGYMKPDHSAAGLITITNQDHSWSASYQWQTAP
ncbi:MAG: hypothetical protein KAR47_03540 [Planctomycetes bacterium]|nr:hypothetical protein [Planctomycetota bacterium]